MIVLDKSFFNTCCACFCLQDLAILSSYFCSELSLKPTARNQNCAESEMNPTRPLILSQPLYHSKAVSHRCALLHTSADVVVLFLALATHSHCCSCFFIHRHMLSDCAAHLTVLLETGHSLPMAMCCKSIHHGFL